MQRQRGVVHPPEGSRPLEQRADRHLRLEARQAGTETVVRPEAEREHAGVLPPDVEDVGLLEYRLVTVRRPDPADDELALPDGYAVDGCRPRRPPGIQLHG